MHSDKDLEQLVQNNFDKLTCSDELPLLNYYQHSNNENTKNNNKVVPPEIITKYNSFTLPIYSNFGAIEVSWIVFLRFKVANNMLDEEVEGWLEKLLRYLEIRYSFLEKNENKYKRNINTSNKIFIQLTALFIDVYLKVNDIRYLNTALKIFDLRWAIKNNNLATTVLYQQNELLLQYCLVKVAGTNQQ